MIDFLKEIQTSSMFVIGGWVFIIWALIDSHNDDKYKVGIVLFVAAIILIIIGR